MEQDRAPVLALVREAGIRGLLGGAGGRRFEASGVYLKDGWSGIIHAFLLLKKAGGLTALQDHQ